MKASRAAWIAGTGAAVAAAVVLLTEPGPGDYKHTSRPFDDAGPAIWALIHGRLGDIPETQPLMGLVSILLRVPFAAAGHVTGGLVDEYRFGAFACAWALAAVAVGVAISARSLGWPMRATVVLLIMANPATTGSLDAGHPEELLLAALSIAGVWAVADGRTTLGAVLTGLAVGTKPFGIFALLAALVAAPQAARRTVVIAVVTAAVFVLPLPLASPGTYSHLSRDLASLTRTYSASAWWPFAHERVLTVQTGGGARPELHTIRVMPDGLNRGTGTLAALAFALVAAVGSRRLDLRAGSRHALALLAVLMLARAALDPQNLEYYLAPGLAALAAWEVLTRARPPIVAAIAIALDYVTFHAGVGRGSLQTAVFLAWTAPLLAYLLVPRRALLVVFRRVV